MKHHRESPMNVMSRLYYNWIINEQLEPRKNLNDPERFCNFFGRARGWHVFVGNFTYVCDFMILEDARSIIHTQLSEVVLGKPFVEVSKLAYDQFEGTIQFADGIDEVTYRKPHNMEELHYVSTL